MRAAPPFLREQSCTEVVVAWLSGRAERRRAWIVALATGLTASTAALAQAPSDPLPPTSTDEAGVAAWVHQYLQPGAWRVIGADDVAVALREDNPVGLTPDGMPHGMIRQEYFRPGSSGGNTMRSSLQVRVFDCAHARQRVVWTATFEHNNTNQNHGAAQDMQASWTDVAPGSLQARTLEEMCRAAGQAVSPSAAQPSDAPAPASIDDAGVAAWMSAYLHIEGWTVFGADDVAVSLGSPDGVAVLGDGTLQATIRHEYYGPAEWDGQRVRSIVLTQNLDCAHHSYKTTEMSTYERSNMQGAAHAAAISDPSWQTPTTPSLTERAFQRACRAPVDGVRHP
jgi:hypothetical protein